MMKPQIPRILTKRPFTTSLKPQKSLFPQKQASKSLFSKKSPKASQKDVQPKSPARTRFAPSPTGFLHLGSLRTALYNYLLAKSTKGTFILRIEDTDQKRLVPGAEKNIIETLKWCGINVDEGAVSKEEGRDKGKFGPYRQSERSQIYAKYTDELILKGKAYRCFCLKERLNALTESAKKMVPPTTVSYDRHCAHIDLSESLERSKKEPFVIRFKSPKVYPPFTDLLHGKINLQPQVNPNDVRYEDPVLVKSDGLPTYHFANVIDDHLMKITHVIRGEEWLASTPKHIAMYEAFGWDTPEFVHIPLLTSTSDKKLSKRSGDSDVMSMKAKGILPEALVNFAVLFGWSPKREPGKPATEVFTLPELEKAFSINDLTKGNAKVDDKKLHFFNKAHLLRKLSEDGSFFEHQVDFVHTSLGAKYGVSREKVADILKATAKNLETVNELLGDNYKYLFEAPIFEPETVSNQDTLKILQVAGQYLDSKAILQQLPDLNKKQVFQTVRYALTGKVSGLGLDVIIGLLGKDVSRTRIENAQDLLSGVNR